MQPSGPGEPDDTTLEPASGSTLDTSDLRGLRDPTEPASLGEDAAGGDGASEEANDPQWNADSVWSPLTVLKVVNPLDHGAVGDGEADDLPALVATVDALPSEGGLVYLPAGTSFQKRNNLYIRKGHVKLWAPNGQAEIFQVVDGARRRQAILCEDTSWCGFFGVKLRSDATERFDALEDNPITIDHSTDTEIVGVEVEGAAASGIFLFGATRAYIEGNYVHHTWADHIHHTEGTLASWCWDNYLFNEAPSLGDDGIACVTYGTDSPRCGDMEWWHNVMLGNGWGRGFSVIGGNDISIHDNWSMHTAGAGIIVASESSFDTAASRNVLVRDNFLYKAAHRIGHAALLVSGQHNPAGPLTDLTFLRNVAVDTVTGQAFRSEGAYQNLVNRDTSTNAVDLPAPMPSVADVKLRDTAVLKTRDTSFVPAELREGLYRIHVRESPTGAGFEQRFEYVVRGPATDVDPFIAAQVQAGAYLAEVRTVRLERFAVLLTAQPIAIGAGVDGVAFRSLRAGDLEGSLSWLWTLLDDGTY